MDEVFIIEVKIDNRQEKKNLKGELNRFKMKKNIFFIFLFGILNNNEENELVILIKYYR